MKLIMKHLEIKLKVMPALCLMRVVISEAAVIQGTKDTKVGMFFIILWSIPMRIWPAF